MKPLKNLGQKAEARYLGNRKLTIHANDRQPDRQIAAHHLTQLGYGRYTVDRDGRGVQVSGKVYDEIVAQLGATLAQLNAEEGRMQMGIPKIHPFHEAITDALVQHGESLLNDKGVDAKVANQIAKDIIDRLSKISLVVAVHSHSHGIDAYVSALNPHTACPSEDQMVTAHDINLDGGEDLLIAPLQPLHQINTIPTAPLT